MFSRCISIHKIMSTCNYEWREDGLFNCIVFTCALHWTVFYLTDYNLFCMKQQKKWNMVYNWSIILLLCISLNTKINWGRMVDKIKISINCYNLLTTKTKYRKQRLMFEQRTYTCIPTRWADMWQKNIIHTQKK